jgi:fucose permease
MKTAGNSFLLMFVAFFGIFVYGLLAALPGSVLPTLERGGFLPSDKAIGDFLLINAVGAVLAYLASGPIIDRLGKKAALLFGALVVIVSMVGFALTVSRVPPQSALFLVMAGAFVLGLGANAIVSAGHALVAHAASSWRNAALNLLDICFGLGLASLPLVVQVLQRGGGLELIFWSLAAAAGLLLLLVVTSKFPPAEHAESFPIHETGGLLRNPHFWLLALALFMYVGAEVSVGKWVVTYMERDPQLLAGLGLDASRLQEMVRVAPESLSRFFEEDAKGIEVATFALRTLSFFAFALLAGRLVSSVLLGVFRVNSLWLLAAGSAITAASLLAAFTTADPGLVRWALVATGFGMGPIFPTSVGLASVMAPRISGTAMSLVMGVGFAGLLLIPPAVGYVSDARGGRAGDLRGGLMVVLAAAVAMLVLHLVLAVRQRSSA